MDENSTRGSSGAPRGVDDAFIRSAIDQANLNVLRLALYQVTKDPELAEMRVEKAPDRGGAQLIDVLAPEHHAALKQKAFAYLSRSGPPAPPPPDKEEARFMMELFQGGGMSDVEVDFGYEELAFDPFPREVTWTKEPPEDTLAKFRVIVIGAGISGISASIQLERLGIQHVVLERQADIGGTWQRNTYPEARVDTSSFLYQFKFEKNYPWSEYFASRQETQKYLKHLVRKFGIAKNIRLETEVVEVSWDEDCSEWIVTTRNADGSSKTSRANVVVSASGLFGMAKKPDIPGIEDFQGRMFHTTAWEDDFDYAGKRVALIGNGSSGTQLMPELARQAETLTCFQRTPAWIVRMENYRAPVTAELRWLLDTMPYYWNWYCYAGYLTTLGLQDLLFYDRDWQNKGGIISERNDRAREIMTKYIEGKLEGRPDLIEKSIPSYAPLGRRIVIDNGWYDALRRDNVELVTTRITRFTSNGVLTEDGVERDFDLIVLGSGFQVHNYLWPVQYKGRNGTTLEGAWKRDGPRAYLGVTVPGFPNFFMFYGPNGQPSTVGFYSWAELWTRYIASAIVLVIEKGFETVEVRPDVFEEYNSRIDAGFDDMIWKIEGRTGYYINQFGRVGTNMPWRVHDYYNKIATFDVVSYTLGGR